jgi:hypothetical protein
MKIPFPLRTIESAVYTPADERTDDGGNVNGDVTYVRYSECGHVMLGNPTMTFRVGDKRGCYDCAKEGE